MSSSRFRCLCSTRTRLSRSVNFAGRTMSASRIEGVWTERRLASSPRGSRTMSCPCRCCTALDSGFHISEPQRELAESYSRPDPLDPACRHGSSRKHQRLKPVIRAETDENDCSTMASSLAESSLCRTYQEREDHERFALAGELGLPVAHDHDIEGLISNSWARRSQDFRLVLRHSRKPGRLSLLTICDTWERTAISPMMSVRHVLQFVLQLLKRTRRASSDCRRHKS